MTTFTANRIIMRKMKNVFFSSEMFNVQSSVFHITFVIIALFVLMLGPNKG